MAGKSDSFWWNRSDRPTREVLLDLPEEEYHAHDALGHTDCLRIYKSPKLYRFSKDNPVDPTSKALLLGSATHAAALEPEEFDAKFKVLPPDIDGYGPRSGHYRAALDEMKDGQPDVRWLTPTEYDTVIAMAESALSHPLLGDFLSRPHKVEGSAFFRIKRTLCKCRPDLVVYGKGREVDVLDLKTCQDASPGVSGFPRQIATWGYDTQQIWYTRGLEKNGLKVKRFIFLAVEKAPPYLTGAFEINPEYMDTARDIISMAIATYMDCRQRDTWPGYGTGVHKVELPPWRASRRSEFSDFAEDKWRTIKQLSKEFRLSLKWTGDLVRRLRKEKRIEWTRNGGRLFVEIESFRRTRLSRS